METPWFLDVLVPNQSRRETGGSQTGPGIDRDVRRFLGSDLALVPVRPIGAVLGGTPDDLSSPPLRTLSRRLVYCEAPDVMPPGVRADYTRGIAARLHSRSEAAGRWTTLDDAIEDASKLLEGTTGDRNVLIRNHLDHLTRWRDKAAAQLAMG